MIEEWSREMISTTNMNERHKKLAEALNRVGQYDLADKCRMFVGDTNGDTYALTDDKGQPLTIGDLREACGELNK